MQPNHLLLIPLIALLANVQSIDFPSLNIDVTSMPDAESFVPSTDLSNSQSSSSSFSSSSSSSSFANGRGSSSISQVSTTCDSDANCETLVNGIVNGTVVGVSGLTAGPMGNSALLGGSANLPASGTVGTTVVVTGTPIGTPTGMAKLQEASSKAGKRADNMGNLMKLVLGIAIGALVL
ncbi:05b9f14e-f5d5-4733-98aa-5a2fa0b97a72 [Sclerotinia trifoliorum]|uniref:05b9f14e-f5d5-4733-98aa-5a2fa0b97a72 n=1 Tax=Sclerotinia trifoliorum TaxID=28548 RepID=A0A8H2ZRM0_9HELO|nr:05b9f14e-f5d5-4733-98aa-5a2fa0b97a72 [Sclerotinia trifoliorum]